MKALVFTVFFFVTFLSFSQEEEFIPIDIEGKEAYMSTKTGEYTYLEHAKTDATQLKTTASGVVYTDISSHTIVKGETLSVIAKKTGITISEIKKHNKGINSSSLNIGEKLKIIKKILVKSSSPVISTSGEERIIAKLRPGESPGQFAAPPSVDVVESKVIETKKTEEKVAAKTYKVDDKNIKNPVFGLSEASETLETDTLEGELKSILKDAKTEPIVEETVLKEVIKEKAVNTKVVEEVVETKQTPQELTRAEKAEKLKQIKAEAKKLEAELEAEPEESTDVVIKETVTEENKVITDEKPLETEAEKAARLVKATKKAEAIVEKEKVKKIVKEETVEKEVEKTEQESEVQYFHTVKKGESFYSIAKKYKMTTEALMVLNKTKSANLDIGQKLKIINPKK